MKVAVVTCYKHTNYVRAITLRRAVAAVPKTEVLIVKNRHKSLLRYPEVIARLLWTRLRHRPDVYLVTFRAYEILPIAALLRWPKKLMYDEFLNPLEWLEEDRKEWWAKFIPKKLLKAFYRLLLKRCSLVLTDTDAHAASSSKLLGIAQDKFMSIPVGSDEDLFHPIKDRTLTKKFTVFYYGSMLPLHGLDVVISAAEEVRDLPVQFVLAGGGKPAQLAVQKANDNGAHVEYRTWVPYEQLAELAGRSHLTLCGPFGDTPQARMVITGKTYQFLACGVPVVIGKTLAADMFTDKKDCLITPLGDAKELASVIRWAYEHQDKLEAIGQNGYKLYAEQFSSDALAARMATILQRLS